MLQEHLQNFETSSGNFKISRFQNSNVPRQHYSSCIYKGTLCLPGSDSDKNFRKPGFVINLEKSNLVPSQVVLFQGFIVDSKKMSFSFPDSKIQSISLSAQTLLNQPKLSLRKLSQMGCAMLQELQSSKHLFITD